MAPWDVTLSIASHDEPTLPAELVPRSTTLGTTWRHFGPEHYKKAAEAALTELLLQVVTLAKPGRDGFRSRPGVLRLICGGDRHAPPGFVIGAHLDIMPFFGEAIPNHFRQFFGRYLYFQHGSVPLFPYIVGSVVLQGPLLLFPYFTKYPISGTFCGRTSAFLVLRRETTKFVISSWPHDVVIFRNRDAEGPRKNLPFLRWQICQSNFQDAERRSSELCQTQPRQPSNPKAELKPTFGICRLS